MLTGRSGQHEAGNELLTALNYVLRLEFLIMLIIPHQI